MLKLFKQLSVFFDDCYKRVSVREFAKIIGVSPPTASTILSLFEQEGLLKKEQFRAYTLYFSSRTGLFVQLSRIYWQIQLSGLVEYVQKEIPGCTLVLFGSLSKAEAKADSDIDLAIFGSLKDLSLKKFEKKLTRSIQLLWFKDVDSIDNKELRTNILNGHVLCGRLR